MFIVLSKSKAVSLKTTISPLLGLFAKLGLKLGVVIFKIADEVAIKGLNDFKLVSLSKKFLVFIAFRDCKLPVCSIFDYNVCAC